ncbi:MAG: hypothetical protein CM1200mP30_16120 [Pseudomonadota bacterium]|nr:MAG: hypothetical protein CM1200mP30_16120 [Pseudomonadota bacterium]
MKTNFFYFFKYTCYIINLNIPKLDKLLTQIIVFFFLLFLQFSLHYISEYFHTFFSSSTTAKAAASISLRHVDVFLMYCNQRFS